MKTHRGLNTCSHCKLLGKEHEGCIHMKPMRWKVMCKCGWMNHLENSPSGQVCQNPDHTHKLKVKDV